MRASRLLTILMLLQMRGRMSAAALAREFEVSVRTIYRDLDALSASGVPVYTEAGRNGGVSLHEGYRTRLTGLTTPEAAALPLAGIGTVAQELGVGTEAAAAQLKMLASLPAAAGASAQRVAQRFHLDPLPWYFRAEELDCLRALASAVWLEKRIEVEYESWSGAAKRRLDPLGLVQKGGLWYLVATARGKPRTYRVASIRRLEVLPAASSRPARFDLARYWAASTADFETRLMRERATIRISPEGCQILRAVNPAAAQSVDSTQRPCEPRGWVVAEIPVESPTYSAKQLLRLGAEMEVLEPRELRAAVASEAKAVLTTHMGRARP
jgi:predicted DNA-binding transcriptional regulator YafY